MDLNSVEFYTILLVIAFALLGMLFSPKNKVAATTDMVEMSVSPSSQPGESVKIKMEALENGFVKMNHDNIPLHDGETVNIVATTAGDSVKLLEKKGVKSAGAEERRYTAEAIFTFLRQRTFNMRFESEVSGQWCTFQFANVPGNIKEIELRL